jgi:hypothetical protein
MIFRALFWIGLVSLLAPHEPDLGLGHPGAGTLQSASAGLSRTGRSCGSPCAGGLGFMEHIRFDTGASVSAGLADVKAQIEADQQARRMRPQES